MSKGPSPKSDHLRAAREARAGKSVSPPKIAKDDHPSDPPAAKKPKKPRAR